MNLTLHGLHWRAETPSCFTLLSVREDVNQDELHSVSVVFEGGCWSILYSIPGRLPISRQFESRDAAMALIASRRDVA